MLFVLVLCVYVVTFCLWDEKLKRFVFWFLLRRLLAQDLVCVLNFV